MPNITDQINCTTSDEAQQAAFELLDKVQSIQPAGLQVVAAAFLFQLLCERFKQDPREVLYKTSAVLKDSLTVGRGEYTRALINYVKEEMK